jgi:hypothetical protein
MNPRPAFVQQSPSTPVTTEAHMTLPSISLNQLSREHLDALYFLALDLREIVERGSADHRYLNDLIAKVERHLSQGNPGGDRERPSPEPDRRAATLELQAVKLKSRGPQPPLTESCDAASVLLGTGRCWP